MGLNFGGALRALGAAALVLGAAAACATAPQSLSFPADSPSGLLVYQFDTSEPILVRVDLDAGTGSREQITLGNGVTFRSSAVGSGFGQRALPPGDYAIVNRLTSSGYYSYVDTCYDRAALTFRVRPGVVNVLPSFDAMMRSATNPSNDALVSRARSALASYPGVTAEVQPAEIVGLVEFSQAETADIMRNSCGSGSRVRLIPDDEIMQRDATGLKSP